MSVTPANGYTGTVTFGTHRRCRPEPQPPSRPPPSPCPDRARMTSRPSASPPGTLSLRRHRDRRDDHAPDAGVARGRPPRLRQRPRCRAAEPRPEPAAASELHLGGRDRAPSATTCRSPPRRRSPAADIVQQASGIATTTHTAAADLATNTTYYWRVRTTSACGTGPPGRRPFRFTTTAPAAGCPLGTSAQSCVRASRSRRGARLDAQRHGRHLGRLEARARTTALSRSRRTTRRPSATSGSSLRPSRCPPDQSPVTLQFWNWQQIEAEVPTASLTVGCRDGALLEVSTNDGGSWLPASTLLTDPYDGQVSTGDRQPARRGVRLVRRPAGLAQLRRGPRRPGPDRPCDSASAWARTARSRARAGTSTS